MTLKQTIGKTPLPVNWQDSAWDLEVRVEGRLHEEEEGMRSGDCGARNRADFKFWRCGSRGSNRRGRRLEHARARVLLNVNGRARVLPIFETLRGGIMK